MAIVVERKRLSLLERTYLPQIVSGLFITFRNIFKPRVTLQYPDQRPVLPKHYRGAPTLVRDSEGREKCVSCQLCEFVCPSKAIRIIPGEIDSDGGYAYIEKAPQKFQIDMTRCIFCGMCEEVCPEQAIFLQDEFSLTGYTRAELLFNKEKLYSIGGVMPDKIRKWKKVKDNAELGGSH